MMKFFQEIFWSIRFKRFFPFLIYDDSKIKITTVESFEFHHRIRFGNPKKMARVSAVSINFFAGKNSVINFGHSICIGPGVNIIVKDNAKLKIGSNTYFTSDSHIESLKEITIGKNCAISWGVTIIDHNHHSIEYANLHQERFGVYIGDHVWVGCNSIVLPGSEIGDNCIVAAGSVVKGIFPSNSLIAGNPAKIIKSNVSWK